MRELSSAAYWAVAGALICFGGFGLMSIGLPFLLIGCLMAVLGLFMLGIEGAWAITIGIGAIPIYLIASDVIAAVGSSGPPCPQAGSSGVIEGSGTVTASAGAGENVVVSCSPPITENYIAQVVFFGAIALSGPVVRLVLLIRGRSSGGTPHPPG